MNSEAEIKQDFNDTLSNTNCIECNITQNIFPIEEINIKEEPIEYENGEQKIPPGAIIFNQNIDCKPQFLETDDCKITYNLSDDCKSLIHHQLKSETGQTDTGPLETEVYNKEGMNEEKVYYTNSAFKVDPNDISSNTIYTECNIAQKNVFPLAEIDTKSECLEIEDSKISYNLIDHRFKSENGEMDCIPPETEVYDKVSETQYKSSIESNMKTEQLADNKYKTNPVQTYRRTMEKMFKCNLCEYESKHQSNMVTHVKNKHKEYERQKCMYESDRKRFVRTAQNLYKCKLCEYESRHRSSIYGHILSKHDRTSVKKHKCSQCEYQTHESSQMKRHLLIHDDIRRYECEVCNKRFRHKHSLKVHSWTHSGEKRFQCSYCDYRNNQEFGIKIHVKNKHVKLKTREYKCPQCPYETNSKTNFNKHGRQHLLGVEKEFKCSQCSYDTNFKSCLKLHVQNKHEEVKEYKCEKCKYETNYKTNMKQHMREHDSIITYECNICNKSFKSNVCLRQHVNCVHLERKKFHCAHCDFKTNYKFNLVLHVNSKHVAAQIKNASARNVIVKPTVIKLTKDISKTT